MKDGHETMTEEEIRAAALDYYHKVATEVITQDMDPANPITRMTIGRLVLWSTGAIFEVGRFFFHAH